MSEPPASTGDRPLTQTSNPVSYAGSLRRPDSSTENTPPHHSSGKPRSRTSESDSQSNARAPTLASATTGSANTAHTAQPEPSTKPWRLESYATILNQGRGGPQLVGSREGVSEIDIILDGRGKLTVSRVNINSCTSFIHSCRFNIYFNKLHLNILCILLVRCMPYCSVLWPSFCFVFQDIEDIFLILV